MPIKKSLEQLNKKELLSIISKMKKNQLIDIINMHFINKISKKGGSGGEIIKETKNAIRKSIVFNQAKLYEENNNDSMNNNSIYNNNY